MLRGLRLKGPTNGRLFAAPRIHQVDRHRAVGRNVPRPVSWRPFPLPPRNRHHVRSGDTGRIFAAIEADPGDQIAAPDGADLTREAGRRERRIHHATDVRGRQSQFSSFPAAPVQAAADFSLASA